MLPLAAAADKPCMTLPTLPDVPPKAGAEAAPNSEGEEAGAAPPNMLPVCPKPPAAGEEAAPNAPANAPPCGWAGGADCPVLTPAW
jgi:hypothetical protein